ncbi:MAG: hypothetical protein H6672_14675 [Anaerolineaceae bacterium]|nr:hypothetical protein [Anaerolineaceae bacterium]
MGSDITDFMAQLPFGLILMVCGSAILLVIVMAYIISARARRSKAPTPPATAAYVGAPSPDDSSQSGDLPDLDMLVDVSSLAAPPPQAPAPPPQPIAAPPPRTPRKGTYSVNVNDGDETEAVEVMAILRDVVDGKLIVQVGDKRYKNIHADEDFKDKFNKLMRELVQTAQNKPVAPPPARQQPGPEAPAPAAPPPAPETAQSTLPPAAPSPPRKVESAPPPATPDVPVPGDLPSFRIDDQQPIQTRKRGQKLDLQPVPELDIAGAIEAYLQYKLTHTPEYAGRSIHVYPSPDGGVRIEVDGQFYDGVSDITDDAVREFMQQTIQEWQDRH